MIYQACLAPSYFPLIVKNVKRPRFVDVVGGKRRRSDNDRMEFSKLKAVFEWLHFAKFK